jgi:hypothetical protein
VYTPAIAGKKKKKKNTHSIMPPPFSLSIDIKKIKTPPHSFLPTEQGNKPATSSLCGPGQTPQVFN